MNESYVLHVTKKCNMDCVYCYEKDKQSEYTWEDLKKVIDDIFLNMPLNTVAHMEFLGGEPLMNFPLLAQAYSYMQENYKNKILNYTITTNGTILNDKIIEFLKANPNVTFAVSMDGLRYSNQLRVMKDAQGNNTNSYEKVVENFKILQEHGLSPSVHMVTHPYNVAFLFENIKHLYEDLHITSIGIGTVESTMQIDDEYCDTFINQIKKVALYVLALPKSSLYVDLLEGLKSRQDVRTYVTDSSGKLLFESYGRLEGDVTSKKTSDYIISKCDSLSDITEKIYKIREYAYTFYQNLRREKEMSLLAKAQEGRPDSVFVKDCVGKSGLCEYVTEPVSGKLYKNIDLGSLKVNQEMEDLTYQEKNFVEILKDLESSQSSKESAACACGSSEFEEVVTAALKLLINKVEDLSARLKSKGV